MWTLRLTIAYVVIFYNKRNSLFTLKDSLSLANSKIMLKRPADAHFSSVISQLGLKGQPETFLSNEPSAQIKTAFMPNKTRI